MRARRDRTAELPIPGYDALSASQVVERLAGLADDELDAVRAYEAAHRNRRTILGKIEQLDLRAWRKPRVRRPRPTSTDSSLSHASLRGELRAMRGGALWEVREARAEPLAETFAELLDRDDAVVIVGTIDDVVVGYGALELETLRDGRRLGVIDELYVEPDARAVGVGEAIATELVAFCAEAGCIGVDAVALPGHRAAKNFFERAGFTARALVMHKPLRLGP